MLDFHVCSWKSQPELSPDNDSLAVHFDALNEPVFTKTLQVGSGCGLAGRGWGSQGRG